VAWNIVFTKQARKDYKKLHKSGLFKEASQLLDQLEKNPFVDPPPYKELTGGLDGAFSRSLSYQHRLVYSVNPKNKTLKMIRMWSHYE
jgi:toxin YoeB